MPIAALALIWIGYGFAYSGISQLVKGGSGWGLFKSLIGDKSTGGAKTNALGGGSDSGGLNSGIDKLVGGIGGGGSTLPSSPSNQGGTPGQSPASGVTRV